MPIPESTAHNSIAQSPLIAVLAVVGLLAIGLTWFLWSRSGGHRRRSAVLCGTIAFGIHVWLFYLVPEHSRQGAGEEEVAGYVDGDAPVMVTVSGHESFDAEQTASEDVDDAFFVPPLPLEIDATEDTPSVEAIAEPVQPTFDVLKSSDPPSLIAASEENELPEMQLDALLTELLAANEPIANDQNQVSHSLDAGLSHMPLPSPQPLSGSRLPGQLASAQIPSVRANDFANRTGVARRNALIATGGTAQTEAAVEAALRLLALRQQPDGTWDPVSTGAGQERKILGHDRHGSGRRAVTGITGIAVLAMLGRGDTHQSGVYAENIARGLQALIDRQGSDGSLGGPAGTYARMYCHGIAALALSEAYALTRDPRLAQPTANALSYSARIQHPQTGGWRYQPGDTGDMSQFGWQAMAMQSGKQAGLTFDHRIDDRLKAFLNSVRSGRGGLASYRPRLPASRTMTAEALASRLLLGHHVPNVEIREAESYLLQELPGTESDNLYYWYYGSLALHQLQSPAWQSWNQAMKSRLLGTQRPDGGWPTTTIWGGYGGEIYTTAMAALCLEVYYRHLTLHQGPDKIASRSDSMLSR